MDRGSWWAAVYGVTQSQTQLTEVKLLQLSLTLCDPMDCNLPGSSVYGNLPARILAWVAISFSRGSSQARERPQVSHIAGRLFTI